jgi:GNAT superfamily N-acetyltransferase
MIEPDPTEHERLRPLFAPLAHHLAADAVLSGTATGKVWVDEAARPKTAVCWTSHRLYCGGQESAQLPTFFAETFRPTALAAGRRGAIMYLPPDWAVRPEALFPQARLLPGGYLYFRQDARQRAWPLAVPDGLTLRPVDGALLADPAIENIAYVTEEMVSERPSVADFLARSFGYCLVHEKRIIGWCMTEYNTGNRCELGIETATPFRRRGLAVVLATAVIRHALQSGIHDIGWVCSADNLPSIATALKLGFRQTAQDAVALLRF